MLAGVLNLPISLMLFFIGSALFVFYRHHPGLLDPALPNDSIFPYFVGHATARRDRGLDHRGHFRRRDVHRQRHGQCHLGDCGAGFSRAVPARRAAKRPA